MGWAQLRPHPAGGSAYRFVGRIETRQRNASGHHYIGTRSRRHRDAHSVGGHIARHRGVGLVNVLFAGRRAPVSPVDRPGDTLKV